MRFKNWIFVEYGQIEYFLSSIVRNRQININKNNNPFISHENSYNPLKMIGPIVQF